MTSWAHSDTVGKFDDTFDCKPLDKVQGCMLNNEKITPHYRFIQSFGKQEPTVNYDLREF